MTTRTRSQISKTNRTKGATYEREVAADLLLLTGIGFERNLEQVRKAGQGDLIPDDEAWPFTIECKRVESKLRMAEWRRQAVEAAKASRLLPAVVYRQNSQPTRVSVPLSAIGRGIDEIRPWPADEWAEISLEGFAFLAAEIMAWDDSAPLAPDAKKPAKQGDTA
jgi:hypothetical protein